MTDTFLITELPPAEGKSKPRPVRWTDICRTMRIMGLMADYSKGECLRVHALLDKRVKDKHVRKLERGLYQRVDD